MHLCLSEGWRAEGELPLPHELTPPPPSPLAPSPPRARASGTTGTPKGVMHTHRAVVAAVSGVHTMLGQAGIGFSPTDCMVSYLTLAHIFGRVVEEFALSVGAGIGYWQARAREVVVCCVLLVRACWAGGGVVVRASVRACAPCPAVSAFPLHTHKPTRTRRATSSC